MTVPFAEVDDGDREALVDFMFAHAPIMMFPLSNLTRYGLGGTHPRAISAWVARDGDDITDVITMSHEGMVFPCCPTGPWAAAAQVLKGRHVKGFIGDGGQVGALRKAVGIIETAELDALEPAYFLSLADLKVPDVAGFTLRPLAAASHELMVQWRCAFDIETLNAPPDVAMRDAERRIRDYKAVDTYRVLLKGDTPLAMTGFNASLPEIVQIGGVYTPPALRGQGYARMAVALHLQEVALDGVTEAVLCAANPAAARAYEALGFQRTGDFALVVYKTARMAHG